MKKLISTLFAIAIFFNFIACKTSSKKDPNFLGDFPAQKLGKTMAGTVKRLKNTIKPTDFTFVFYPRTNILSMHHKFMGDNIWLSLTEKNRQLLTDSINRYLDEIKNQTLTIENSEKKAYFGKTKIRLSWGIFGATREVTPTVRCEYQILTENRPYFILANQSISSEDNANCPAMRMAFSPAQCKELLQVIDQKNLLILVEELKKDFNRYDIEEKNNRHPVEEKQEQKIKYDTNF